MHESLERHLDINHDIHKHLALRHNHKVGRLWWAKVTYIMVAENRVREECQTREGNRSDVDLEAIPSQLMPRHMDSRGRSVPIKLKLP